MKLHIIDLQKLNYLKNKAFAFGRNSHLSVSNPLLPEQRHLDQFETFRTKPSVTHPEASWKH